MTIVQNLGNSEKRQEENKNLPPAHFLGGTCLQGGGCGVDPESEKVQGEPFRGAGRRQRRGGVSQNGLKSVPASEESRSRWGVVSSRGMCPLAAAGKVSWMRRGLRIARWQRSAGRVGRGRLGRRRSLPFTPDPLPALGARSATPLAWLARLSLLSNPDGSARSLPLPLAGITTASQIKR